MLIEQRIAEFWFELQFFIGTEAPGVFINRNQVIVTRKKIAAVLHLFDRRMLTQRAINRIGIGDKFWRQVQQIKFFCNGSVIYCAHGTVNF